MAFELLMTTEPDSAGVVDGRVLARELIMTAFQALVPYVHGCPSCADRLFTVVANAAIQEVHDGADENGELPGGVYQLFGTKSDAERHLEQSVETTRAMLEKAGGCCEH